MRWLTWRPGRAARAERDLLAQALEAREGWHQLADERGQLLWASRGGGFGGDPERPIHLWLQEALGADREQLRRLHDLQTAAARAVPAEEDFHLPSSGRGSLRVRLRPLPGPPAALLWSLEALPRPTMEQLSVPPALLAEAQFGLYLAAADGALAAVNRPLAQWLGRPTTPAARIDGRLRDFLLEETSSAAESNSLLPTEGKTEEARSGRVLLRAADGSAFAAQVTELRLGAREGQQTLGLVQRLEEDAAAPADGALERLSQEAPVGVAHLGATGSVLECNRAFAEFLGREPGDTVGRLLQDLVEPSQRTALTAALDRLVREGGSGSGAAFELRTGRPLRRITSLVLRPLPDVEGLGAYLLDLTEQKTLEARAAQSQKMQAVGQLAGGIAHDFNNLLTAMIGFADLLLARHGPGDPSFGEIMQIKQNANRAANLIRQLLAFSRQQSLQSRVLSLTNILEDITHLLRRLIGDKVDLEVVHGRDLWSVKADQGQLEQVIINLAINGRDAMHEGGLLRIRTANLELHQEQPALSDTIPRGDYVRLEVEDSGGGIPPENLERVFEPFFSTKEVGEGTGLGLSTVYGIVKQTGGYITIESELGEGTRLHIYLPRHAEALPEETSRERDRPKDLTGRGKLLLVEDEDAVRAFSAAALRSKGYEVLEASSGDEALELLQALTEEEAPEEETAEEEVLDLLITDVVMPRVDGPTLVREARQRLPTLKVIYISGYAEDSLRAQLGREDRQAHYLPKPFSLKQLAAKVKEVMHGERDRP